MNNNLVNINDMLITNIIKLIDYSKEFIYLNINTFELLDFSSFSCIVNNKEINKDWVWFKLNKNYKIIQLHIENDNDLNDNMKKQMLKKARTIVKFMMDYKNILEIE